MVHICYVQIYAMYKLRFCTSCNLYEKPIQFATSTSILLCCSGLPPYIKTMGNVNRFQGHLLPYPNKPTFQEIPAFSRPGSILPIQKSSTIWSVHCSSRIHNSSQESQTDGSKQGCKEPSVTRQFVG